VELGEIGSFDCVLEWIASSCIECERLECLGEVNGGGWGCIYSPQPLPSRCSLSADRGRSAPLVRTVRPYTSTAEIATASSNDYINGYYALNALSDVRYRSRGRSGRAPRTVRPCTPDGPRGRLKFILPNPSPSGFSGSSRPNGPRLRPDGSRLVSDDARFFIGRSVVLTCIYAVFLSEGHLGVADGPPQGPGQSTLRCFPKKLLLSGIIYGIPDSRLRMIVDELMHL
jgi:hypothetical protein